MIRRSSFADPALASRITRVACRLSLRFGQCGRALVVGGLFAGPRLSGGRLEFPRRTLFFPRLGFDGLAGKARSLPLGKDCVVQRRLGTELFERRLLGFGGERNALLESRLFEWRHVSGGILCRWECLGVSPAQRKIREPMRFSKNLMARVCGQRMLAFAE